MSILEKLRGGLIVSVQAWSGSAIDDPPIIAAMAAAAIANGACGVRVAGIENLRAVRARIEAPIIGLIKQTYAGFEPYITPTLAEVRAIITCGAQIVAFDSTARARPGGVTLAQIVDEIRGAGAVAMADCATPGDALAAQAAGAQIVATTLCGYTPETKGCTLPALDLVRALAELPAFVIAEGGIRAPVEVAATLASGADAVVVGTAITNIDWLVREFSKATHKHG